MKKYVYIIYKYVLLPLGQLGQALNCSPHKLQWPVRVWDDWMEYNQSCPSPKLISWIIA